ncbi:MAG TPA: immunoglobulin domain-containing protein [Opitutaceae bacterium]|nr:immunoglobulin domain-containing protein [Opitutaceae bacterium]
MKIFSRLFLRLRPVGLPGAFLIALLQRTPVVRVAVLADEMVASSSVGAVLRSAVAVAASLGAVHALAGATTLSVSSGTSSGITFAAGSSGTVAFGTFGTQSQPASWSISGPFPPGMKFSSGSNSLTAAGTINTPNGVLVLSGTPTTAGSYAMQLVAYEGSNRTLTRSPTYTYTVTVTGNVAPAIVVQPTNQSASVGGLVTLSASASGSPSPTFQWLHNGSNVPGGTSSTLQIGSVQPIDAGIYWAAATNSAGTATTQSVIVGVRTAALVAGNGVILNTDVPHPNGNHYDLVLPTGTAESITNRTQGRTIRTSFIDLNDNIVQVEFAGGGTLSLVFDAPSGPAEPTKYNQPGVSYMKGHAGIVITDAGETTNVSVFSVGRATAFDPTGGYNILFPVSSTNDPANNGSPLFAGQTTPQTDGFANIAFIAISSGNGQFGGVRASNVRFFATKGFTGVYAPGVTFQGPLFIGNIDAFDAATPVIQAGSVSDARITGGNLAQDNSASVQISGISQLKFTDGQSSHGVLQPAQANQGRLTQNGTDVTALVVAPAP